MVSTNETNVDTTGISSDFNTPTSEYLEEIVWGGKWYYTQNTPGTEWFDFVDNNKGWTVDFNLTVDKIENSHVFLDGNKDRGAGIYVNDGVNKESINFLTQEIIFSNINEKIIYNTTSETNYRLTGKENGLKLFAKKTNETAYSEIANVKFNDFATEEGNSLKPIVTEDINGDLHTVWYDDGNNTGQIYYAKYSDGEWSIPELIVEDATGSQVPCIAVDNEENVYVAYEKDISSNSIIGFIYKNSLGWSDSIILGTTTGNSNRPRLIFDSQYNVVVVWEDHRFGHPEIYLNRFIRENQNFESEVRITRTTYGCFTPSVSSYLDNIFIVWKKENTTETSIIEIVRYDILSSSISSVVSLSNPIGNSAYPDTICDVKGRVFVVWHDNITGKYEIYGSILSPDLVIVSDNLQITIGKGGAQYPVLAEKQQTGDIYIVWQDYEIDYKEFNPLDEYSGEEDDPYERALAQEVKPLKLAIYIALYDNALEEYLSSGFGSFDVHLQFLDDRSNYYPSVPKNFRNDLPILYETLFRDIDWVIPNSELFSHIGCAMYGLERKPEYLISHGLTDISDPYLYVDPYIDRDFIVSGKGSRKEIRFGDFSDVMNVHYSFKHFKLYLKDAVDPFAINEVRADTFPQMETLTAHDVVVNNYGDAWIVGTCGMMFYVNDQNTLALVGEDEDIDPGSQAVNIGTGNLKAIAFNNDNYLFVAKKDEGLYYSIEHIRCFYKLLGEDVLGGYVTFIAFDKNDILFVGTNNGLKIYKITDNGDKTLSYTDLDAEITGEPSYHITSIKVDDNNIVWVGTYNGLYRYYNKSFIHFTVADGLPSSRINDIAIRNTAIRYIATAQGIAKMIGSAVDDLLQTNNSGLWNNNVKSVMWQDPNILWAGTLSKINQITVNDVENSYTSLIYEPGGSASFNSNDLQIYYIVTGEEGQIEENDIVEVYINGNLIPFGYRIGYDSRIGQKLIRFETPLRNNDMVDVVVRKDLNLKTSFVQSVEEKKTVGEKLIRIKDIGIDNDLLYVVTEGDENEVKVNDINNKLPFDKIHLDTYPPNGTVDIVEQIDRSIVKVSVTDITDADPYGGTGSGVSNMIVSNYQNFTTDGVISQLPIPYSSILQHDLGLSLESVTTELQFTTGYGSHVSYFSITNELFASSSLPGIVYKYNNLTSTWDSLFSYENGNYVDFIAQYNNRLIISVGHVTDVAKIFIYQYPNSTSSSQSFVSMGYITVSESRAFCFQELDNTLYIGTGVGDGGEYGSGAGLNGGKIYSYDGLNIREIVRNIDDNIYGLTVSEGGSNLIAATGESGFIYEIDPLGGIAFPIFNDVESLSSVGFITYNSQGLYFVGNNSRGIIRRSPIDSASYDISFRTTPSKISQLKTFSVKSSSDGLLSNVLHAAVGNIVYYLSDAGSWTWKYSHTENISDIAFNPATSSLYVISDSNITRVDPLTQDKSIYLKLFDKAGNETNLYDSVGTVKSNLTDSISISDLRNFVNENKIFELDEFGNVVFTLRGNNAFYSGNKIDQEQGIYESEIFDGTVDLVKWEAISWQATELTNTEVKVYVRTSSSKNDILLENWVGPFYNISSSGVDLSYLSGQFIQFKVELTSTQKDLSPTFNRATIRAVSGESVHFFTTNFVLPSKITKGILTSQKVIPVSADIVFGINTTNSVDWVDYQIIDENRVFDVNQQGEKFRVGIKFISPTRSVYEPTDFDEYGPYNTTLFINTIDFNYTNTSGVSNNYYFKITLYEDIGLTNPVFVGYSYDSQDGFSVDGSKITEDGVIIENNESVSVLFTPVGSPDILCNSYYFVKIEATDDLSIFENIDDSHAFITGCSAAFVDIIDFDFTNTTSSTQNYQFRIKFYTDTERTNEFLTVFSGNDRTGWTVDSVDISEDGAAVASKQKVNIVYSPELDQFQVGNTYYLTIDAHDGSSYVFTSNAYNFQVRDLSTLVYCGEYYDVPIVNNLGIMFELENNQFITLNL